MNLSIEQLNLLGENENGATFSLETRTASAFVFAQRKAGSVSGNHYHKGDSAGKNPEILILTAGSASLYAKDLTSNEEREMVIEAPTKVEIGANVLHTVTAITDISFLELNSIEEHKKDTYYPD